MTQSIRKAFPNLGPERAMQSNSEGRSDTVAVLGGGLMAQAVIPHLRDAGFALRLYNRTLERLRQFTGPGVTLCDTPSDSARGAYVVLSFVSDDEAAAAVWFGENGALGSMAPGAIALECSTLSDQHMRRWIALCRRNQVRPLDVALTGSTPRAAQGTLIAFAGGDSSDLHEAGRLMSTFTEKVVHFGPPGSGMRYKLVHNFAAAATLTGLAEALTLAEHTGLDMQQVCETLSAFGWAAPVAQSKARAMVDHGHRSVMCSVNNLAKDVRYARALAEDDIILPVAHAMEKQFDEALARGANDMDMSAIKLAYDA
ncbi:NAD(P)-dependent oxidoreductase [Streptomyces sp. NPDC002659]|uniref:NAD(P)-dependent oxidoreductase n=1 Tax=Streptomyces sp. NPDC002659 TaxID=3364656 RepID=UPI0036B616D9